MERLKLLESEFNNEELNELMRKLREGTLSEEEMRRLQALMKELGIELSEEDAKRMRD